jgi:hypothetical protein
MQQSEENGIGRNGDGTFTHGNKLASHRGQNKISIKVKAALVKFLEDNIENVQQSFDTLKPIEKLQFVTAILPYAVPKMATLQQEIEQETNHSGKITIEIIKSNGAVESNTGI